VIPVTTQLLIYETAVPILRERHGNWSVEVGADYGFSRRVNSVPLMAVEFPHAAPEYVIVFAGTGEAVLPAVLLGVRGEENLYLTKQGGWGARYLPAFVRRYPFIFSSDDMGTRFTLCLDEGFAGCNQAGRGERLFDDQGKPTPYVENVLRFLQEYQAQFQRTQAFCQRLMALDLLEPMEAKVTLTSGERLALTGFRGVNRDRLKGLAGETLATLAKTDELELVYLHLQSMRNMATLRDRFVRARADEAQTTRGEGPPAVRGRTPAEADRDAPERPRPGRAGCWPRIRQGMYNAKFIFEECGFDWIPESINRDLLFNVSYDLQSGEIKIYILDESRTFLYKISRDSITKQYDALTSGAKPERLSQFLETEFDYDDLVLDTVEEEVYYLFIEETSPGQYIEFLTALCRKFGITDSAFIQAVNRINKRGVQTLSECCRQRSVSGVKVPFSGPSCKIYSRPFRTGNLYDLNPQAITFLTRVHDCDENALAEHLPYLWVSTECTSSRIVITTQHHRLRHAP
jgi:hypothetical protein